MSANNFDKFFHNTRILVRSMGHSWMTVDHIAINALKLESVSDFFYSTYKIDTDKMREAIKLSMTSEVYPRIGSNSQQPPTSFSSKIINELEKNAVLEQLRNSDTTVQGYFILYECLAFPGTFFEAFLQDNKLERNDVAHELQAYIEKNVENVSLNKTSVSDSDEVSTSSGKGKDPLAKYTTDLTALARDGEISPLIGRTVEVADLAQVLSRKNKKNPVLVGEPGVGKTQIVDGLALLIATGDVPESLKDARLLSLNMGAFTAGTKYRGDFEARVDLLLKELKKDTNIILFIDELHNIMGAGSASGNSMDMSNLLKPALSRGECRIVGATTFEEYRKHIEKDGAMARRFMKIDVVEPTLDEVRQIITGVLPTYEKFHQVTFEPEAITAVLELSEKYMKNKNFPDKAIDLLDAAGARNRARTVPNDVISQFDIENEVSRIVNIPVDIIACTESDRMVSLSDKLKERVFGQDQAVDKLVENVMVARAGLRSESSVQGAFLFVGSSGTGKTEISKALSNELGVKLIRFDMSEFSQEHTVAKLIGSPPGYVGHEDGNGLLLDKVEENPNCVLLLDEIEKAHKKVLLTFLQVLDEGRLTGSQGKTVYFNNVTVIMTTNLGARDSKRVSIGHSSNSTDNFDKAITDFLPPEFINRIDATVKFKELTKDVIVGVIDKFLAELNTTTNKKGVHVEVTQSAIDFLAKNGVTPGMGARPMKRCIETNIKVPLAYEMLCGSLKEGGNAKFDVVDGKMVLVK